MNTASNDSAIQAASSFAELARNFCNWAESETLGKSPATSVAVWIAKLHAAALLLHEVAPDNADGLPDLLDSEVAAAERNLAQFNGLYYRACYDPDPRLDDDPSMGDVGDDLLDTYLDLKRGLIVFDQNHPNEALWHWSFMHRHHWGDHVVGALYALQRLPRELLD